MVWANQSALDLWGAATSGDLVGVPFDHAMPAVHTLSGIVPDAGSQFAKLTFWTEHGIRRVTGEITSVAFGEEDDSLLIEMASKMQSEPVPSLSRARTWAAEAKPSVVSSDVPVSPLLAYKQGLARRLGDADPDTRRVAVPAQSPGVSELDPALAVAAVETDNALNHGLIEPVPDRLGAGGSAVAERPPEVDLSVPSHDDASEDIGHVYGDADAMREIADQIRKALPFANGVETADRFFGYTRDTETIADQDDNDPAGSAETTARSEQDNHPVSEPQEGVGTRAESDGEMNRSKAVEEPVLLSSEDERRTNPDDIAFLAKVSHEVRTPLNAIIGFSEMMRDERLGPMENDSYKGYARDIHESALHALSLINDLLDLSKINAGEALAERAPFDLGRLIKGTVSTFEPQAEAERITLHVQVEDDLPMLMADERQVRQILMNLVSNSIKFTRARGEVIVSAAFNPRAGFVIGVRDTGVGMSQSEIAQAMQPFKQVANAPRQSDGTGLGLPLVQAMVSANGGQFELSSAQGRGTLARVVFPPTDGDQDEDA